MPDHDCCVTEGMACPVGEPLSADQQIGGMSETSILPGSLLAELIMTKKKMTLDGPGIDLTVTYKKVSGALGSPKCLCLQGPAAWQIS